MQLDRQAIERRDFPIGRRGYDPDAVDAHLRALAGEFEELHRTAATGAGPDVSLASAAGAQVQTILAAAEAASGEIERQAQEQARELRDGAERDAERTREEALERARAHVAAIGQASAALLERVGAMEGEVGVLVESLRAGAGRLTADLAALETGMRALYDAASGHAADQQAAAMAPPPPPQQAPPPPEAPPAEAEPLLEARPAQAPEGGFVAEQPAPVQQAAPAAAQGVSGDLDGARLVALNMALNGESRAETERYLAENFQLPDRLKLIDEVYAAIES